MCYHGGMDTTIRNLDAKLYRRLRARAVREGKTVGATLNEAMRAFLVASPRPAKSGSIFDLQPFDFGPGNERLSEQIDEVLYGEGS